MKAMRSLRRWAYETFKNEHAIRFVTMVTPEDLKAAAEYIKIADHYVLTPGGANNNNYANVELIVDLARRHKAQVNGKYSNLFTKCSPINKFHVRCTGADSHSKILVEIVQIKLF